MCAQLFAMSLLGGGYECQLLCNTHELVCMRMVPIPNLISFEEDKNMMMRNSERFLLQLITEPSAAARVNFVFFPLSIETALLSWVYEMIGSEVQFFH